MKQVIGLTGGIGSGKSTVADLFAKLGIEIIDADMIARQVVARGTPALRAIKQHFGADVVQTDGTLDREQLRKHIFQNPEDKQWLENLLHPRIREEMVHLLETAESHYVMLVIPLLAEKQGNPFVTRVLVVDCPEDLQVERATKRDKSDEASIRRIIQSQVSRTQRLAIADDVITNDGSLNELEKQVLMLHEKYLYL